MNSINKLKTLTEELPAIPKLADLVSNPGNFRSYIEYEAGEGTIIGFGLLNQQEVGVQKLFLSKGATFPVHSHECEKEWAIIFSGAIKVNVGKVFKTYRTGDCIEVDCALSHSGVALEDTWLITVSIPRIDGYPK